MGDVGLMGMHVPGMSWREMREAAVLAEELGLQLPLAWASRGARTR